ncbi:MAG TPA: hypothetical protein PLN25_00560 [Deltaproteobacteria bacterium]|nr:hypothetical protein [Deltaproteobacteria bacterium]HQB38287.1 hypothetical protein [Deltaproteobacteria bacterium]
MTTDTNNCGLKDVPEGMTVEKIILSKTLQSKLTVDIALVLHNRQYEAALFLERKYKGGPPMPRELETPTDKASHWMSARPKIGLTPEEAEKVIDEVLSENRVKKINFKDTWGAEYEE